MMALGPSVATSAARPSRRTCGGAGATSAAAGHCRRGSGLDRQGRTGATDTTAEHPRRRARALAAAQRASSLDVLGRSLGSAGEEVRARRYSAGEANGLAAAPATCGRGRRPARAAALRRE
jgi:hypothetical protein